MNENPAAKLFKEPAIWPNIAPWWLVSSTEAAALLNVKPATLHSWRVRGFGPPVVPPMYLRPTQGKPLYYQFGALRTWAASKLGMAYLFEDQCHDFFHRSAPVLLNGTGSLQGRIEFFDNMFKNDRNEARKGLPPGTIAVDVLHELDVYYSRQPRSIGSKAGLLSDR